MKTRSMTRDRVVELLHYDPETGLFTWKNCAGRYGRIAAGTIAGSIGKIHGYVEIHFDDALHKAHRLAWLCMTGKLPPHEMDHINRIRHDNRFCNLRLATLQDNLKNKTRYKNNTSGYPGVTWHKHIRQWQARIGADGIRHHLGYWDDQSKAVAAYRAAKAKIHPLATVA